MAEKGAKKFPPVSGNKTASKSSGKKEGKDGSSSMKGRKVQFQSSDSEASPRVGSRVSSKADGQGVFETPVGKGDWGKGGKDYRLGKGGGKSSLPPVEKVAIAKVELKIEEELPKNAKCIMDCEAAAILQGIQEQMAILSEDPAIKIPESFLKGLQYAKTSDQYTNPDSVRQVLQSRSLKRNGISDGEMCMIANVCPETVDEVFALIPSLKDKRKTNEKPIEDALHKLATLKQSV
ncbi:DNA-directed RNA polymerases IV and V subunit 4-like isoform X2 [Tasmannia lanceolata]|uniref:DNA-directed RNA polymerases IV and V subunit 4-like isoform X2 n=1 Tax=Tasmannia lanceolata TaxID=3420 RepID=UPI004062AFD5